MSKHTPGPWYADKKGLIWRRPPSDLYENGGGVAGDMPIATAHERLRFGYDSIGWSWEGLEGYPVKANARLIASAPELLEALRQISLCSKNSMSDRHEMGKIARQAIAKAEAL